MYVATGVYQEAIFLSDNVHVYGGYSGDFSERDAVLYESAVVGPPPSADAPGTINGQGLGIVGESTLSGFTIFGGNGIEAGESSAAIHLRDCGPKLTLVSNAIYAGNGAPGLTGSNGESGLSGTSGFTGVVGSNTASTNCTAIDQADGGPGGSMSCGNIDVSGGNGGKRLCPVAPSDVKNQTQSPVSSEYGGTGENNTGDFGNGGNPGWHSLGLYLLLRVQQ